MAVVSGSIKVKKKDFEEVEFKYQEQQLSKGGAGSRGQKSQIKRGGREVSSIRKGESESNGDHLQTGFDVKHSTSPK